MSYKIAIPTYDRYDNFKTIDFLKRNNVSIDMIDIFVANEEQLQLYKNSIGENYNFIVGVLGICNQRNFITDYYDEGQIIVSMDDDIEDLIPMILDAKKISKEGFKMIASPWTAPPWMKDNNHYVGGKLLPQYYDVFALYFAKYLEAYKGKGIDIWGLTAINEPHGNGSNWESTHFTPKEMTDFVENYLGPKLEKVGWGDV